MKLGWTRRRTLIAGLGIIIVTNAISLAGVAYNRAGEPTSRIELSERELALPRRFGMARESSAIFLTLRWRVACERAEPYGAFALRYCSAPWLTAAKLSELGFDLAPAADTAARRRHYERLRSKETYLVLEQNGTAYQATLARTRDWAAQEEALGSSNPGNKEFAERAGRAHHRLKEEAERASRLFVIDAGLDAAALRARYPDRSRYALVRGRIQPRGTAQRTIEGFVEQLTIETLYVPRPWRELFMPLVDRQDDNVAPARPPYAVMIAYGARYEPWIVTAPVIP